MQSDDLHRPDNRTETGDTSLGERLQRNLRGVIVAVALTLAAIAVLVSHYSL